MAAAIKIEEAIRRRGLPFPLTTGLLMALPAAQAQSGSGSYLAGKPSPLLSIRLRGSRVTWRPACMRNSSNVTCPATSLPQSA